MEFGHPTKERLIGKGAYGEVWEGSHFLHGKVAIKILRNVPGQKLLQRRKERILEEAARLKKAEYRNIVKVHDVIESNEIPLPPAPIDARELWMITEFCEGGSLDDVYAQGPITLQEVRKVLLDATFGLRTLHNRGIIHRDIKPGNILKAGDGTIKIGDFGYSTDELIAGYGEKGGYELHAAPEMLLEKDPYSSEKTDIWALALTAYRLLHGKTFFDRHAFKLFPDYVKRGKIPQALPWLEHIPSDWRKFICKAMQSDSRKRIQSADEMAEVIRQLPIAPSWQCSVTDDLTEWVLTEKNRNPITVRRSRVGELFEWEAYREDKNGKVSQGKSKKPLKEKEVTVELQSFFVSRQR